MNNLYILTEERAKRSVIKQIIEAYSEDFNREVVFNNEIKILPQIKDGKHTFVYDIFGVEIENIKDIKMFIVSGPSSFMDFLIFEQEYVPDVDKENNLIMLVEETKTSDKESRNAGVLQRSSKFVYANYHYPDIQKYMLYNSENNHHDKKPSPTNIFGTNLLLTQQVKFIGKNMGYFREFESIKDLVNSKNSMKKPPRSNVPVRISVNEDEIGISGRLSNPSKKGNIGYDPNIGYLSFISRTLRLFGWDGKIKIKCHGVKQEKIDRMRNNKFLNIASFLDIELEGVHFEKRELPKNYWYYEKNSEKLVTIFLHILAINSDENIKGIYENHAGCERGYFYTKEQEPLQIKKVGEDSKKIKIPDLILRNERFKEIILIEGKKSSNLNKGLEEIEHFDSIEQFYISPHYPVYSIQRWVVTYGEDIYQDDLNPKVLFHLNKDGSFYVNNNAPSWIKDLLHDN